MNNHATRPLLITTVAGSAQWTRLWNDKKPLIIGQAPSVVSLERTENGVYIRTLSKQLTNEEISTGATIALNKTKSLTLTVRYARTISDNSPSYALPPIDIISDQAAWFIKAMKYTFMGLALALVIIALIPKAKPKPDELIPEQFTKIVMQPRTQKTAASKSNTGATAAVTQAFRAKALQNSMSGLLKGGMTKLLAQSDIVGGHTSNANVKSLFNGKSQALIQTSPNVGSINSRNIQIGGMGAGGAGAKVGYGKGERASVNGQGSALVSLDIPGSSVEEGLTKDEVGAVIHQHMSEIRYCYESAMLRTPDLEGKLIVDFTIGANGTVKSTAAKSSTLADPRLDDCILRRLATWKFPQPKGGIDVAVMYPFIFKTLGK